MISSKEIILAPGWGETRATMASLGRLLASWGLRPEAVAHARHRTGSVDAIMAARAGDIVAIAKAKPGPVTILAHSLGAVDAITAAEMAPTKVHHLILANPAGMVDPVPLHRLMRHFGKKVLRDTPKQWLTATSQVIQNPRLAYFEAKAAARADVRPGLVRLMAAGVKLTVLASHDDLLFDVKHIERGLPSDSLQFIKIPGYHDSIHLQPRRYEAVLRQLLIDAA